MAIVKSEVRSEVPDRIERTAVILQVKDFVFQCSPQPLNENIVQGPAAAIHADQNVLGFESPSECRAGELRSLVGVEDFRTTMPQRAIQSRAAESSVQARRYFPT